MDDISGFSTTNMKWKMKRIL